MGTIAKATLALEAQHAAFSKSVKDAGHDVEKLGHDTEHSSEIIKHAIEALAIAEGAHLLKEMVERTLEQTTASYRLSGALGITNASLKELETAGFLKAGVSAEEFGSTLEHMLKNLGEAADGTGPAKDALDKLLGSAGKIKGLKTDEAFKLIAARIGEIKDPAEQARAATELFGKQGQKLLPLFQSGAEGIEEAAAKADKFGIALSDVDAAKIVAANEKFEEMNLAVQGVENQLTVALAPVLEEIVGKVLDVIPPAEKMRDVFVTGLRYAAKGVAYLVDAYRYLKIGVLGMAYGAVGAFELQTRALAGLADAIVWIHNKLFDEKWTTPRWVQDTVDMVKAARQSIGGDIKDLFDQKSAVDKVDDFFDGIIKKADQTAQDMAKHKADMAAPIAEGFGEARKKIEEILKAMQADVENFGLTEAQKKINELRGLNAKPEDIAKAQGFADQLKGLEDYKKRLEDAKKLTEESLTPIQKYQQELGKLDGFFSDGMIDAQTYWNQVGKLNKELGETLKDPAGGKRPGAVVRRFDFVGPTDTTKVADPMVELKNNGKQQLDAQKKMQAYLADIQRYQMNADNRSNQSVTIDF